MHYSARQGLLVKPTTEAHHGNEDKIARESDHSRFSDLAFHIYCISDASAPRGMKDLISHRPR